MPLVEHFDETRSAALGRGVAVTVLITGGHDHERRVTDEVLDVCCHVLLDFGDGPTGRIGITKLLGKTIGFGGYGHGASFSCTRVCLLLWRYFCTARAAYGTAGAASRWRSSTRTVTTAATPS